LTAGSQTIFAILPLAFSPARPALLLKPKRPARNHFRILVFSTVSANLELDNVLRLIQNLVLLRITAPTNALMDLALRLILFVASLPPKTALSLASTMLALSELVFPLESAMIPFLSIATNLLKLKEPVRKPPVNAILLMAVRSQSRPLLTAKEFSPLVLAKLPSPITLLLDAVRKFPRSVLELILARPTLAITKLVSALPLTSAPL